MIKPGVPQKENENVRLEGYHRHVREGMTGQVDTTEMVVAVKSPDLYVDAIQAQNEDRWITFANRRWRVKPLGPPLVHLYSHTMHFE